MLGDKVVAETVQASEQEMCSPAEHEWRVDFPRKSSVEKHVSGIIWTGPALRSCALRGAVFIVLYIATAAAILLLELRKGAVVTHVSIVGSSLSLSSLAAGAIACGFMEIVILPTARLIRFARLSNISSPSVSELSDLALTSFWPILGMAAFSAIITALTVSIIFLLQQHSK